LDGANAGLAKIILAVRGKGDFGGIDACGDNERR
jgi:hypothetical protein